MGHHYVQSYFKTQKFMSPSGPHCDEPLGFNVTVKAVLSAIILAACECLDKIIAVVSFVKSPQLKLLSK